MAVFAMAAVAASSASAHEWLLNGKPITTAIKIMSDGLLELEDTKATGGAVRVECRGFDEGTVGPGALDTVTNITSEELKGSKTISCGLVKAGLCKAPATAEAVNLPWMTEIYLSSTGQVRDMITPGVAGKNPGWAVTCETILGKTTDTCTIELGSTALVSLATGVDATFEEKSPNANCSVGGTGTGVVRGTDLLLNPVGETLSFF
jgi:hypothetical protein